MASNKLLEDVVKLIDDLRMELEIQARVMQLIRAWAETEDLD